MEWGSRDSLVEGALGLESGDGGALPVERTLGAIWPNRLTLGKAGWCDRKCQWPGHMARARPKSSARVMSDP